MKFLASGASFVQHWNILGRPCCSLGVVDPILLQALIF